MEVAVIAESVDETGSAELVRCSRTDTAGDGAALVLELGVDGLGAGKEELIIVFSTAALKTASDSPTRRSSSS